jgi:hypothetical protein
MTCFADCNSCDQQWLPPFSISKISSSMSPSDNDTHHYIITRKSLLSIFNIGVEPNSPQHEGPTLCEAAYQDLMYPQCIRHTILSSIKQTLSLLTCRCLLRHFLYTDRLMIFVYRQSILCLESIAVFILKVTQTVNHAPHCTWDYSGGRSTIVSRIELDAT